MMSMETAGMFWCYSYQNNLIVQKNTTEHESNFGVIQKQRGKHNEV